MRLASLSGDDIAKMLAILLMFSGFGYAIGAWIDHEQAKDPTRSALTILAEIAGVVGLVIAVIQIATD
ncbi:hypothetical protein [Streptomyces sp. t39]|uniref:hypothetical protein n=1 Tax=Streptomyces sp. t39 TaxID=1828156 RepID=UPI0011CE40DD|nr:hypothetical protein [Streptomyces sp. t39]TXS52758.1 hypothetical protein EAO77_19525 [Streptomyces sp. t39]